MTAFLGRMMGQEPHTVHHMDGTMPQSKDALAYLATLEQTRELLLAFDVVTHAYDPGVEGHWQTTTDVLPKKIDLGANEWEWLQPLLRELLFLRKHDGGIKAQVLDIAH